MMLRPMLACSFVAVLSAACAQTAEPGVQACTLIGCESGVSVVLGSGYDVPVTVEVGPVGGAAQRQVCSDAVACTAGLFFPDLAAPELQVRVISGTDTITRTVRPEYSVTRPNGPDCPPTCRQARVDMSADAPVR